MNQIDTTSASAIRVLAADAVQKAKSGHPGLPLGSAPVACELWVNRMNHNPENPQWKNRNRFVLSGGHGSTLLYSLLHLFGCGLTKEDMMNFRQMNFLIPGHPEYDHTVGVEATTGPPGAGMGTAVGMAMAEVHLSAVFNKDGYPVVDHYTYALGEDGCIVEGISFEAFSLAGTLGSGKLIVFYDSNQISTEGSTDIASTENAQKCTEAFSLQLLMAEDGNDLDVIGKAIQEAKADTTYPSFITIKTQIGYGCLAKWGKASAHGEPLGKDNVAAMKENLNWPPMRPFYVPDEVHASYKAHSERGAETKAKWNALFDEYCGKYLEMKELWNKFYNPRLGNGIYDNEEYWAHDEKSDAARSLSGKQLQKLKNLIPNLIGGAADLAPPIKTYMVDMGDFFKDNYAGCNLHFGIRELVMTATGNGLVLHGGLRAFASTFPVFSDHTKPMARLSALMGVPLTFVFTHDSIGVGEDGSTHEPIEQLVMLRSMSNFHVFRPADVTETAAAWYSAVSPSKTPIALVLTRQNLPQLVGLGKEVLKGAYILEDSVKEVPDAIIIATGLEVELAVGIRAELAKEGMDVRVVSMSSVDVFEEQPEEYKEAVFPKAVRKRVAVEALGDFGRGRYVGPDGITVTMKSSGVSAPAGQLFKKFGSTVENVVAAVKSL